MEHITSYFTSPQFFAYFHFWETNFCAQCSSQCISAVSKFEHSIYVAFNFIYLHLIFFIIRSSTWYSFKLDVLIIFFHSIVPLKYLKNILSIPSLIIFISPPLADIVTQVFSSLKILLIETFFLCVVCFDYKYMLHKMLFKVFF